jgi:hypothetical protein
MLITPIYPANYTGPSTITIVNATDTASFSITANAPDTPPVVAMLVIPTSVWEDGQPAQHFVEITAPCCAREDLCGLTADQVDASPCELP